MNTEAVVSEMGRWQPTDIAFLRRIDYLGYVEADDEPQGSQLRVLALAQPRPPIGSRLGWPDFSSPFWEVEFLFKGVAAFKLEQSGGGDIQVMGFDIEDLSASGWERITMRVYDYESEVISFYASGAEIVRCQRATHTPFIETGRVERLFDGENQQQNG